LKQKEEISLLNSAGGKPTNKFINLQFAVQEFEEEEEARDLTHMAKTSQPISVHHSHCACIGTETTLKQPSIEKKFPQTLEECSRLLEGVKV
jgi:hypothetical protein